MADLSHKQEKINSTGNPGDVSHNSSWVTIRISSQEREALEQWAAKQGVTISGVVRNILFPQGVTDISEINPLILKREIAANTETLKRTFRRIVTHITEIHSEMRSAGCSDTGFHRQMEDIKGLLYILQTSINDVVKLSEGISEMHIVCRPSQQNQSESEEKKPVNNNK